MTICGHCHGTGVVPDGNTSTPSVDALREFCQERGVLIGPGDTVDERVAAELVGKAYRTLVNWRFYGPPASCTPLIYNRQGKRILYRLHDVARWLAENHEAGDACYLP